MQTSESTAYDALGRVTSRTDVLGRVTTTAYSADGLTTTVTNPAGATFGNRAAAVVDSSGVASRTTYTANELNQYTALSVDGVVDYNGAGNSDTALSPLRLVQFIGRVYNQTNTRTCKTNRYIREGVIAPSSKKK